MMRRILLPLLLLGLSACSHRESAPVPRRKAFPRVAVPGMDFAVRDSLPLSMEVNSGQPSFTSVRPDGSVWLTVMYPAYGARILCTFSPVDDSTIASVLDNRYERMSLNAGAGGATMEEFDNPASYHCGIMRSQASSATPVQFISAAGEHPEWVVSGTVFFDHAAAVASADSVRPVIDIMHAEVAKMLRSLHPLRP